ncbi:hypothetical protein NITLEN_20351 [Nitrospira lenta]|uniref:Uncharacterized protein n=1 Tax=Nitrospira lenta TaxID=1436998 RepID=A0A330L4J7_9BACT|nr:hypothetical protein NITLEN_20351 [Nitrospira lenta]
MPSISSSTSSISAQLTPNCLIDPEVYLTPVVFAKIHVIRSRTYEKDA